ETTGESETKRDRGGGHHFVERREEQDEAKKTNQIKQGPGRPDEGKVDPDQLVGPRLRGVEKRRQRRYHHESQRDETDEEIGQQGRDPEASPERAARPVKDDGDGIFEDTKSERSKKEQDDESEPS